MEARLQQLYGLHYCAGLSRVPKADELLGSRRRRVGQARRNHLTNFREIRLASGSALSPERRVDQLDPLVGVSLPEAVHLAEDRVAWRESVYRATSN